MAELEEGTKDGKKFYKKMIPNALSLILPDTKYLTVRYDDFRKSADLRALVGEDKIILTPESHKDMHVISLETLEEMGAEALLVKGGPYQLQPTVSVKLMKKFGWGEDAEDED